MGTIQVSGLVSLVTLQGEEGNLRCDRMVCNTNLENTGDSLESLRARPFPVMGWTNNIALWSVCVTVNQSPEGGSIATETHNVKFYRLF